MLRCARDRIKKIVSTFAHDIRAGATILLGIGAPVLAAGAAGGIEIYEVMLLKTKLQSAVDSAALSSARQHSIDTSSATLTRAQAVADSLVDPLRRGWRIQTTVAGDPKTGSITITQAAERTAFMPALVGLGGYRVNVSATAMSGGGYPLCVLALATGMASTATLAGASALKADNCLVKSNGDLGVTGNASVTAGSAQSVGKASGNISPAPLTDTPVTQDPFASMPIAVPACTDTLPKYGNGTFTLNPGVHCGNLILDGAGKLVLNPGEHYFVGNVFKLDGNSSLSGTDVVLILRGQGELKIDGNASLSINGRKAGQYAGFALIATRDNFGTFSISSSLAGNIHGTIYLPSATLEVKSNQKVADKSPWTIVVARTLRVSAASKLSINSGYEGSTVPVPGGVGPTVTKLQK